MSNMIYKLCVKKIVIFRIRPRLSCQGLFLIKKKKDRRIFWNYNKSNQFMRSVEKKMDQ